ncbi:MAG TPA: AMP-binding protein, partial [Ilumatobacteraceae bacterium]|nr:AMP-binding protein [Ilumatobacteraceae bacterium]
MALDPTGELTLDTLLRHRLAVAPDSPWLIDAERIVSTGEAEVLIADQAARLVEQQPPGTPFVVSGANGVEVALSLFAAGRAGMIWVGIHRRLPADRRTELVDVLRRPAGIAAVDAVAVVAFTSGTSGTPKGVMHSQYNICLPAVMAAARQARVDGWPGSGQTSAHVGFAGENSGVIGMYLALTSINMQILGPIEALVSGASCVCLDITDSVELAEAVQRYGVTSLPMAAPTAFDWVEGGATVDQLRSLVAPVVGGSSLDDRLADRYYQRFGTRLTLGYGLTEAPTSVSRQPLGEPRVPGSSGRPLEHLRVTIRTAEDDREVAPGEQGQICVEPHQSGRYRRTYRPMLGYWGDPPATEQTLRGGRLHTGDHGWIDADGYLHVLGRGSDVIVRGGVNVNLAKIESALLGAPEVADAAVVGLHDERLGQVPAAAVVLINRTGGARTNAPSPTGGTDCAGSDVSGVAEWCVQHLPGPERPVQIAVVEA